MRYEAQAKNTAQEPLYTDLYKDHRPKKRSNIVRNSIAGLAIATTLFIPAISHAQPMPGAVQRPVQVVTAPAQPRSPGLELLVPAMLAIVIIGSILHDHDL
jgi:hypothetical protein